MILSHIVAASENNVIGTNNTLPWNIPEDMKFFREKTKGKALIMGRKTFESVGHPLPNRLNVVVTRQKDFKVDAPNVVIKPDLASAIEHCRGLTSKYGEEIFIIGGGEIFKESLQMVDVIYLTRIHQEFAGDILYPEIPKKEFEVVERRERNDPVPFTFMTYMRRRT
ncbi:MAG: dihydrofolate reductase [Bdellovibrionales bacterium]